MSELYTILDMNNWKGWIYVNNRLYPNVDFSRFVKEHNENTLRNLERVKKEREEEVKIRNENNQLLKDIAGNVDAIANNIKDIHKQLIVIDHLSQSNGVILDQLLDKLLENNHITANVYSALYGIKINTEEQRTEVSAKLAKMVYAGIDITSAIATITSSIITTWFPELFANFWRTFCEHIYYLDVLILYCR